MLIGIASDVLGDRYFIPGYGRGYGVYVHAVGAETLRQGRPLDLGWVLAFLLGIAASALALSRKSPVQRYALLGASFGVLHDHSRLARNPADLHRHHSSAVRADHGGTALGWRRFRVRGLVNPVSNLPNLNALRANRDGRKHALIAARVLNYEEIVADPSRQCRTAAGRADRLAPVGRLARPDLVPGRRRSLRLVRRAARSRSAIISTRFTSLFRNPARVAGRADRPDHRVRGRGRKQPFAFKPPGERPGRRRRGRARRAQVEIPRSRQPSGRVVEAVDAEPARRRDRPRRSLGRLPAQARPRDAADHRRRSARPLDPSRKGPDRRFRIRRRGRAARSHRQADRFRARKSDRRCRRDQPASGASSRLRSTCRRGC